MNIEYIVAVDPGKMTGWARLLEGNHDAGECTLDEFLSWMFSSLQSGVRPQIVCEDFIYTAQTAKKSRQTWSTEGIGVLRFLAKEFDCSFTLQTPSDAKSFATNDKLKSMGWYTKGKGHSNDASRHLLVYTIKNKMVDPRYLL